jgi:cell division protein FtsI/penicillin-binding protein 2
MLGSRVSRTRNGHVAPRALPPRKIQVRPPAARRGAAQSAGKKVAAPAGVLTLGSRRPLLVLVFVVVLAGALTSRLVFWQVMQHSRLARQAISQYDALLVQPALRGQIYDAAGEPLAMDVTSNLLWANPELIRNPAPVAAALAPILGTSVSTLQPLLAQYVKYVPLAQQVTAAQTRQIQALGLPGIFLTPIIKRTYPAGLEASQVLGYVNANKQGQYGLEQEYNGILSGTQGWRSAFTDTAGDSVQLSSAPASDAQAGGDLYLTLDPYVQNLTETALRAAVKQHSADSGVAIVMDPRTGYILGMAGTPSYDPNHYAQYASQEQVFTNPAIQWTYEPGSTFKVVTMAAGLDAGVVTPTTAFDDTGQWVVGDTVLHNWTGGAFGWETMTQVLQHSANVGASFVSSRLGPDRFYKYVQGFGIGKPTGVDLSGEEAGDLPLPGDKTWTVVNQFTNSFGQGETVTPLQLIRAVAAVANGGLMMKPQIVQRIVDHGHIITHRPVVQGRVISERSARTLTQMLVTSAVGGEASLGLVNGYNIAAKTGTANIASPTGGYIPGATIASIVGYAPAFHPRFITLVIIDHPRDTPWGSMAAAPVLHDIFQDLFMHYHIPPSGRPANQ